MKSTLILSMALVGMVGVSSVNAATFTLKNESGGTFTAVSPLPVVTINNGASKAVSISVDIGSGVVGKFNNNAILVCTLQNQRILKTFTGVVKIISGEPTKGNCLPGGPAVICCKKSQTGGF